MRQVSHEIWQHEAGRLVSESAQNLEQRSIGGSLIGRVRPPKNLRINGV
jgi:hypothetical protein